MKRFSMVAAALCAGFLCLQAQVYIDRDGDGLTDDDELDKYLTDPLRRDTDGNKAADGEWAERFKYTSVVRGVVRVAKPCIAAPLSDAWQDVRVLSRGPLWTELEMTGVLWRRGLEPRRLPDPMSLRFQLRPGARIAEDWYGRARPAAMGEWLRPGKTCNWDAALGAAIRAELRAQTGVAPESLSDTELVQLAASWLHATSRCLSRSSLAWMFDLSGAKPSLHPDFLPWVAKNLPSVFSNHEAYASLVFNGQAMWRRRAYEWGLPWCIYTATVLRALGIPTRIVQFAPLSDGESRSPLDIMSAPSALRPVRRFMEADVRYSVEHQHVQAPLGVVSMNEVFVGGRWVLLYLPKDLGAVVFPAAPIHYHVTPGYLFRIHQVADPSEVRYDETWGRMAAALPIAGALVAGTRPWRTASLALVQGRYSRLAVNGLLDGKPPKVSGWEGEEYTRPPAMEETVLAVGDEHFQRVARGIGLHEVPPTMEDLLHFKVYPAWNPSKAVIDTFGGRKGQGAEEDVSFFSFFPEDMAEDAEPTVGSLSNRQRIDSAIPTNMPPAAYKILEAFWIDSPAAATGLMPLPVGIDDTGRAFFVRIARDSGKDSADEAFVKYGARDFSLQAEGGPRIAVELMPWHDRDVFLMRIPFWSYLVMPKEKPHRLSIGKQNPQFAWVLESEVTLRR